MTTNNQNTAKQFPENYFVEKYGLSPTHSEVLAAAPYFVGDRALDVGCGRGRNALYLAQHGYQVDAFDANPHAIDVVEQIVEIEGLDAIRSSVKNLNQDPYIESEYDVIASTVVMMFLEPSTIPVLIKEMQEATKPNGINIIVSAMNTPAHPMQPDFRFGFKEGELSGYYEGWELLKYNEDVGQMHRRDAFGNLVQMQFATMIAKKTV